MPPSLPPKVLKLTPHVDSCLLLQLLPALLQHYPHRRLVELAGCGNRRILSRVLLNIVQPDIKKIFLNIYENGKARLDNTWEDCESQSAWFHPPCRNICTSRRISHLRLFHGAFFRRLALSQLASKSTNLEEIFKKQKRPKMSESNITTCPSLRIQRTAKISVPQWWNMNVWTRWQRESKRLPYFFCPQLLLFFN